MAADGRPGASLLGVHALLLLACAALVLREPAQVVDGWLRWAACLPLRGARWLAPTPAHAATTDAPAWAEVRRVVWSRVERAERARRGGLLWRPPAHGMHAVVCPVVDRRRTGGNGASQLVLGVRRDDLPGAVGLVTSGDALIGFLTEDEDEELAVVRCAHDPDAVRLVAEVEAPSGAGDVSGLRVVVEPASRIDPWPLRCTLIEDPYRAQRLGGGGHAVCALHGFAADDSGLALRTFLGRLRVWGYDTGTGRALPIGFFVEPAPATRDASVVTVWCRGGRAPQAKALPDEAERVAVDAVPWPGDGGRALLVVAQSPRWRRLPVGAAVVAGGHVLVGTVESSGPGDAMLRPLAAADRQPWPLLLVPYAEDLPVAQLSGRLSGVDGGALVVDVDGDPPPGPGLLLCGGGRGEHVPAGLVIGDASVRDGRLLVRPAAAPGGGLAVCVWEAAL